MKSLLVHIASIAVMVHMMFGCSWHHGLGPQACANHGSTIECSHADSELIDCSDHDHPCTDEQDQSSESKSPANLDGGSPGHDHDGCLDDSCIATQLVKFVATSTDSSAEYLGRLENPALVGSQEMTGIRIDPFPDWSHTKTAARAHLLLGVQIL